jgi:hypothetical protein
MSSLSLSSLQNKLRGDWSAHNALLSLQLLPQVNDAFESLDKHSKIRIMVSLLLADENKRNEYKYAISSILTKAYADTDLWVKATSEIVMKRLDFPVTSSSSVSAVADRVVTNCNMQSSNAEEHVSPYFLPHEFKFLSQHLVPSGVVIQRENQYFTPNFEMPVFIALDSQLAQAQKSFVSQV